MFAIEPCTDNCRKLVNNPYHLLIGVSPFNSRFSDTYIAKLVRWASTITSNFDVLLAGEEASLLLQATGTPAGRARRKAREAISRNRRSAQRALRIHSPWSGARIHTFSDFMNFDSYQHSRRWIEHVFENDASFRKACTDMSRQAVHGRLASLGNETTEVTNEQARKAVPYVLAELPFFLDTPSILGVSESVLLYHRPWPLGERIFSGEFPVSISQKQGYAVISESVSEQNVYM
ncbi:cyclo(L-leucyl-L-leucyl) synthase [Actinopolyspora xinjiangensis]|uniref:Cyclodipeptide synthase n=1 Tax=Actinopolyspora xinjiangensis TaxID=405564 RepID=A0A1H0Q4B3_9ACTN|nr:tRNA-dependent cyclodipeptide synthase [Actinopolyspora xinjiangensis]SDP11865.1 cyclo(L-leucyl-L-leucyl) synthase [Actinopolyspora xinjiangensis]